MPISRACGLPERELATVDPLARTAALGCQCAPGPRARSQTQPEGDSGAPRSLVLVLLFLFRLG